MAADWSDRDERQAVACAEYERIMTTPSPPVGGAYLDTGVVGFVFGEMWRRGVLTPRDRRWITLACVGASGAITPIETHVWAALNSGDISHAEFDEFVLHVATQLGWPKASVLYLHGMLAATRLAQQRGDQLQAPDYERWVDPVDDATRRERGERAYREVHGCAAPSAATAFRRSGYLDFLYGEIWTRGRYLTRRDRRIITICCAAAAGVDEETTAHLRAALAMGELSQQELEELVMHYAVYLGWALGRRLDDLLCHVTTEHHSTGGHSER